MSEIDLSSEIVSKVGRKPGEQVTCRRVSANHYRCNWWRSKNTSGDDNLATVGKLCSSRVYQSQFLRVEKSAEGLLITVISSGGGESMAGENA